MISISEWSADEASTDVEYRGRKVEFTFHPGAYTGALVEREGMFVDIIVACVTSWNIDGADPTKREDVAQLPLGLIFAMYRKIGTLANQADPEGEASAT